MACMYFAWQTSVPFLLHQNLFGTTTFITNVYHMACCCGRSPVKNDRFSTFSDACYTANIEKMKEQLKKNAKNKQKVINERGDDGMTPLHRAAQKGSAEVANFLINEKADVNSLNKTGESPLHIACFHRKKAIVEQLLKTDAVKYIDQQDTQHGMTALHVAIYRGAPDIAELLLQANASTAVRDKYGNNALELAEFWVGQAKAGLSSPSAKHQQTLDVLMTRLGNSAS